MGKIIYSKEAIEYTCPVEATLKLIGGKYKALILWHLIDKPMRPCELGRIITATAKMMTQQLRELEKDGFVAREIFPVTPPKVEYSLTEFGRTMIPVLDAICNWGTEHLIIKPQLNCASNVGQS